MPEVRLDIERGILDKKEESPTKTRKSLGMQALRFSEISDMIFLDLLYLLKSTVAGRVTLLAEVQLHAILIFNGGARILRAIATSEVHLSPSYVLFNLKALSIAIARKVALGEKLLPVDAGDCCGR
ncbi:MAG: hypothetical protein HXS44_06865 [Theionarchaea archaeon]|nr:hypothetical protein [Theionarchaea archaeon]MBU7017213.1 hypothetical protein [Theionarchaea archaeon]